MQALRRLILAHSHLAALICAAALALRILIPAGYMLSGDRGGIAVILCPGTVARSGVAAEMPGMDHAMPGHAMSRHAMPGQDKSKAHGEGEMPCAFSGLSAPLLGGADPVLLVLAIAFVAAMALRAPAGPSIRAPSYLRPPLRGPPLFR